MQVHTRTDTMSNIASYYGINARKLQRHYKHQVSGFKDWNQIKHAEEYLIYPENISAHLSIDEVSLSKGELYTIITCKKPKQSNRNSLVAVINGTEAKTIQAVVEKIDLEKRNQVKEITLDMARNMGLAAQNCFVNASQVIDRFHVVHLVMDAMQHVRVKERWKAIEAENAAIKDSKVKGIKYKPEVLSNGDTIKELLARSKYILYKHEQDWTPNQQKRAHLLFEKYPTIKAVYKLVIQFRNIYKHSLKANAETDFIQWKIQATKISIEELNTAIHSLEYHLDEILNFFDNRNTNANAESFNSKIKNFRANLRGVTDVKFFLFRLEKLFA
jgi:transposase